MLIIPSIVLKNGLCVHVMQGQINNAETFSNDAVDVAGRWFDSGARRLHIVDLDGAVEGQAVNNEVIQQISQRFPNFSLQVGGGIRNIEAVETYLEAGVDFVILGTNAVKLPAFITEAAREFPGRIMLSADVQDGKVLTNGRSEVSSLSVLEFADQFSDDNLAAIAYTDISRDGMVAGVNIETTLRLAQSSSLPIIVAGGVSSMADLRALKALSYEGIEAAIVGRALDDGNINIVDAQNQCDD
jgi:phosphoribosylformimino-5-aminoimidazole carboxamide ribotide isomerase